MKDTAGKKCLTLPLLFIALLTVPGMISCTTSTSGRVIDWVNFIHFGGITYLAVAPKPGRAINAGDLGPIFAKVQFKLEGNVQNPEYQSKDGDAAFLDAGTSVYTLKGYSPSFRLAAWTNKALTLYEADTNPRARKGGDLLDIGGKVSSIAIVSEQDGVSELGAIKDPQQIATLVNMILTAPVDQKRQPGNQRYFLVFRLLDGTSVTRVYWQDTAELARGILLPQAFAIAINAAKR